MFHPLLSITITACFQVPAYSWMSPPAKMVRESQLKYIRCDTDIGKTAQESSILTSALKKHHAHLLPHSSEKILADETRLPSSAPPSLIDRYGQLPTIVSNEIPAPAALHAAVPFSESSRADGDLGSERCFVCMDGPADAVLVECGHGGLCAACACRPAPRRRCSSSRRRRRDCSRAPRGGRRR